MLLAFLTLLGVIVLVAVVGFFMLRKGPEIIQGQAEVTEYRVSSKVPGRILEFRVKQETKSPGRRYTRHPGGSRRNSQNGTGSRRRSGCTGTERKSHQRSASGTNSSGL